MTTETEFKTSIHTDWVSLQREIENPAKDQTATVRMKEGGSYTYTYASLDSILRYVRPILYKHGFGITQDVISSEVSPMIGVVTQILHASGQSFEFGPLYLPAGDAKASGSAITYARRYALCAALNIAAEEDDDGKASGGRADKPVPQAATEGVSPDDGTRQPVVGDGEASATGECRHEIVDEVNAAGMKLPAGFYHCVTCGAISKKGGTAW